VPDPDGTVVRFYYHTGPTGQFTGLDMRGGQVVGTYHTHGCTNPRRQGRQRP